MDIKKEILDVIDPLDFWKAEFPEWDGKSKVECPNSSMHEGGDDSTESLSLTDTGAFKCFGCGWHGTTILGYYTDQYCNGNFKKALALLFNKYVQTTINPEVVRDYSRNLKKKKPLRSKLLARRGWDTSTLRKFKLGWDSVTKRVTIPILTSAGYVVDIRMHDALKKQKVKRNPVIAWTKESKNMNWFPLLPVNPFKEQEVWCLEGEPDVLLASQEGLNCVTITGGVAAWAGLPYERLRIFEGKDVVVCFDSDKPGREGAERFVKRLAEVEAASIKVLRLPFPNCDVTDCMLSHGYTVEDLKRLAQETNYVFKNRSKRTVSVDLADTSRAEYTNQFVRSAVLVSGKHPAPYLVPKKLKLECIPGENGYCANCPCQDKEGRGDYFVHTDDPTFLQWLYAKPHVHHSLVKKSLGLPTKCAMSVEVETWQNVEGVRLIPALTDSSTNNRNRYVERYGYYLGHDLDTNNQYDCLAIPTTHPKSNESVLLLKEASQTSDSIGNFKLTSEQISSFQRLFDHPPKKILKHIAKMMSSNVTKIIGRPDLHIAVDLCYHSPLNFSFNGTPLPKGSMELLLLGDTRCGKGQVAEGVSRFFDLGSTISGENASFMGLVGGAIKSPEGRFMLSWGAFPLNHGRLLNVDEFSGLAEDVLGRCSRVRSEGIAEIDKAGIHSKTPANVRTIWIANPRKGREMSFFNTGVEAVLNLVNTQEDVARFDLALIVSKNEVDPRDINMGTLKRVRTPFSKEVLRSVVLWCWSRRSENVQFTGKATARILKASLKLSQIYSSTIPLVQGENVRFKIAKIAVSIAGRCFSTPDGVTLQVKEEHVKLAVQIMRWFYDKPSFGYLAYSEHRRASEFLVDIKNLEGMVFQFDFGTQKLFIEGLLEVHEFDVRDVQDWLDCDGNIAKKYLGQLVRCHAVKKLSRGQYIKRPAFVSWLSKAKKNVKQAKRSR